MPADTPPTNDQDGEVDFPALLPNPTFDADMPLTDREKKWGFTLDELRGASKVVRTLFLDPSLFVGDPYLSDSRLYTMITRDRQRKREHREVYKAIMNEEKSRRKRYQREQNQVALGLTIMKREREDALSALLLEGAPTSEAPLLLMEGGASAGGTAADAAAPVSGVAPATATSEDAGLSAEDRAHLRLIGAFENLLRLERCLAGREWFESTHAAPPTGEARTIAAGTPQLVTGATDERRRRLQGGGDVGGVDWEAASQLTAQVYRYVVHGFGSQMPPPLFAGPVPAGASARERRSYIRGLKLQLAAEALALLSGPSVCEGDPATKRPRAEVGGALPSPSLSAALRATDECDCLVSVPSPAAGGQAALVWAACTSVQALRALMGCGAVHGDGVAAEEARALAEVTVTARMPAAELLRVVDATLTGGPGEVPWSSTASSDTDPVSSAECSLNLFLARRLYACQRIRAFGESPIVVDRQPPTSESEEPDTWSVFDDIQSYATAHHDGDGLQLNGWRSCNICKVRFNRLHPYYYSMCHLCGEFNYNKRLLTRDLRGKVVLLTGCRIKIGYAMALSLLRCGAVVLGTTRFAHEAAARFQQEPDYDQWSDRLHLYSLDMRDLWVVTQFCGFVRKHFPKLFAVVNNAAQTIARTPQYTEHLRRIELDPAPQLRRAIAEDSTAHEWHRFFLHHTTVTIGQALSIEHPPTHQPFLPIAGQGSTGTGSGADVRVVGEEGEEDSPEVQAETMPVSAPAAPLAGAAVDTPTTTTINHTHTQTNTNTNTAAGSLAGAGTASVPSGIVDHVKDQVGTSLVFDRYDTQAEESDHRESNSWVMRLAEVQGSEAAEVMAINALAPFIINGKLKPCLTNRTGDATANEARFIINVSAMEGQFYRFKQTTHPHTNMAKAALNMMTRTSANDYAEDGIYMNSVDTGWITDESPKMKKERRAEQYLLCPLDEVDAAARCLDLIYVDSPVHGHFYKDFRSIPW